MQKKILSLALAVVAAAFFIACSSNGVSSSDVNSLISGPNSIKGTISGTMKDTAVAFSIPFDFHVSNNDTQNSESYSESWIESNGGTYDGDTVLWLEQYFYFDRNGISYQGNEWSASGQYVYLEFYMDIKKMKLMPADYSEGDPYLDGFWQQITPWHTRFIYGESFSSGTASGTLDITGLKYDKGSQILSGKLTMSLPDNHTQNNWYSNTKAANLTADFRIYVPKEDFQVSKKGSYYGINYRKHGK